MRTIVSKNSLNYWLIQFELCQLCCIGKRDIIITNSHFNSRILSKLLIFGQFDVATTTTAKPGKHWTRTWLPTQTRWPPTSYCPSRRPCGSGWPHSRQSPRATTSSRASGSHPGPTRHPGEFLAMASSPTSSTASSSVAKDGTMLWKTVSGSTRDTATCWRLATGTISTATTRGLMLRQRHVVNQKLGLVIFLLLY